MGIISVHLSIIYASRLQLSVPSDLNVLNYSFQTKQN